MDNIILPKGITIRPFDNHYQVSCIIVTKGGRDIKNIYLGVFSELLIAKKELAKYRKYLKETNNDWKLALEKYKNE